MEKETIRDLIAWLQARVNLAGSEAGITIVFDEPGAADFTSHGFARPAIDATLEQSWWVEMVADVVETPDFAEPDESPEQILQYARDVVSEYIRKRL